MSDVVTLGIDVGGTTIKSALVDARGVGTDFRRVGTPRGDRTGTRTTSAIAAIIDAYASAHDLFGVGLAVPGVVDDTSGQVIAAANLGWIDVPIRTMVEEVTGRRIAFGHDVRCGAIAESTLDDPAFGRIEHGHVSVFVPIGTGIAAATVIDGMPVVSEGWAGEIGHVAVAMTAARAGVVPLTLEGVASAASIARRIGCENARVAARLVTEGDERAGAVWSDAVAALADALAWTTAVVGADHIIVGGGLAESGDLLLAPLRDALDTRLGMLRRPRLSRARFGDRAATIGAGYLAHRVATA